jgi:transposase
MTTVGLDLAKKVFRVYGVDADGRVLVRRQLRRSNMPRGIIALPGRHGGLRDCAPLGTCDIGARAYGEDDASRLRQTIRQARQDGRRRRGGD